MIVLLSGSIGCGKTTVCEQLVLLLRQKGLRPAGLLAPLLADADGRKRGIRLQRVETGEERVLALTDRSLPGPRFGRYAFDACVMAWGLAGLRDALRCDYDLVIIDEIGPLELVRHEGLAPVLDDLRTLDGTNVLVVVREALVGRLKERLGKLELMTFRVGAEGRDDLPLKIAEWYFPQLTPDYEV